MDRLVGRSLAGTLGLLFAAALSMAAEAGKNEFVGGLDLLTNEKWSDAAASFRKAVEADDENAIYYLHMGVALTMSGDSPGAKAAFSRAGKLEPRNGDVLVWSYARLQMYESTAFGGSPPYKSAPYGRKLCDNAIAYGSPRGGEAKEKAWRVIVDIAKQFAWAQLGKGGAVAVTGDRVEELYKAGKYQDCLDLLNKLRAAGPIDWRMTGFSAHCKLALGDVAGAREEYTAALRIAPLSAGYLIGRARTEIAMGALRDADADFALSRQIDPDLTDRFIKDAEKLLAAARARQTDATPAKLWADLKAAAVSDTSPDQLVPIADQLNRARGGLRYVRDEEYTREQTRLQIVINQSPGQSQPFVDMATFLLNPTVKRKVSLPNVDATARIPCGQSNTARAETYLTEALKIDPKHTGAMEQTALLYLTNGKFNDMIAWVQKALDAGVNTVDLSKMYLDYYTMLANNLASEAAALRSPTITHEDRHEGNQIVTYQITTPPTAWALARAAQLDRQANEYRSKSCLPMQALARQLKDSSAPIDQINYLLANAHYYFWLGKYDDAIASAQKALAIDPYDLETLSYLVDTCPKVGMKDLATQYQDQLNNMANPSSGRTLDKIWPQLKQTRFKGAKELLAKAEEIDPGSPHIACANFAIAQEQQKLDDAVLASRILLAMEHARVAGTGRSLSDKAKEPLIGTDAIVCVYVHTSLSNMLNDAGRFDEVLDHSSRAIRLGVRVPKGGYKVAIPETIKPENARDIGSDLGSLFATANRMAAFKLIAKGDYKQAANHVVVLANLEPPDRQATQIGYDIYKSEGFGPLQGKVPDGWKMMFEQWDHERQNDQQFGRPNSTGGNAEIQAIEQEIDKISREIQRGVGPHDLRELESRRDALLEKRKQLQAAPRRRGTQRD